MTAVLEPPGREGGPCVGGCDHDECAVMRATARVLCALCGSPIGYDTPYEQHERGIAHTLCVEEDG